MSITRKETRHGRCPFCESQTTKNDRINTDHVAIWCAKCGATMEIPQGKMSYSDALDMLYDRWYSRPIEKKLQARIAELENDVEKWKDGHKLMFDTAMKKDHEFGLTMQYANELVESKRRIAELEGKTMQCHRCGDPITNELGDNPICGACALASELNAMTLQARITELEAENAIFRAADYEALKNAEEKPIYCAKCRDGIVSDDDGICGICAGAQDGVIESLQNKVAELKKLAIVWHKYPYEKPELNVKCLVMFDDGEPIIDSFDGFYWFDIEKTWVDRITHWAYLPEPPEDK